MTNQFINNQEPIKNRQREIEETIGRGAGQVLKLNPPQFKDLTRSEDGIRLPQYSAKQINRITLSLIKVL